MEIKLSRRGIRRLAWVVVPLAVLAGLALLGRSVTPRDAAGNPLILSPSLKATLEYRAQARRWVGQLAGLDRDLAALLSDEQDIYHQTQAVNGLLDRSLRLAQGIELRRAPAAQAGLQGLLSQAGLAYLEAARSAADWVGAPTLDQEQAARATLQAARDLLVQVEGSRWLQEPQAPVSAPISPDAAGGTNVAPDEEGWWTP